MYPLQIMLKRNGVFGEGRIILRVFEYVVSEGEAVFKLSIARYRSRFKNAGIVLLGSLH
jgi:hypothetical protein